MTLAAVAMPYERRAPTLKELVEAPPKLCVYDCRCECRVFWLPGQNRCSRCLSKERRYLPSDLEDASTSANSRLEYSKAAQSQVFYRLNPCRTPHSHGSIARLAIALLRPSFDELGHPALVPGIASGGFLQPPGPLDH